MKHYLARLTASLVLMLAVSIGTVAPALAVTTCTPPAANSSKGQVLSGAGIGQSANDCGAGVTTLAQSVVSILSYIVGIVAIIMMIVAGLKYITSNGDSNSISSAKNTLIYALVGVAVAALAQALVHYVLGNVGS